ncbi:MAG TPA: YfhO family protein [Acidimicrobiales bacterium]|nr:YfhO family protein [Acidimicrobiales bacterium]
MSRWQTLAPEALVALAVLFNLWVLRAQRLVVAYPNDLAFHRKMVWTATRLLSHGELPLSHWFPHLSLGSPLFVQYQSASAILTGAAGLVVGPKQAFAWSLYLLLALWPVCIYWTGRLLGWSRWECGTAAAISPLLFSITGRGFEDQAYAWLGSGLWSQLWAMWTLPLAIGFTWRYLTQRRYLLGAVLTLSLTIAFHYLMGYLAALILVVMVLVKPSDVVRRLGRAGIVGGCALVATLWITVPLLSVAKWTALNEFQVGTTIDDSYGARVILKWLVAGRLFDYNRLPVVSILLAVGLAVCIARFRRDERARLLVLVFFLSLCLYFGRPTLGFVLNRLPGNRDLLFQRFLGGVQLAGIFLAAVGAVWLVRLAVASVRQAWPDTVRRVARRPHTAALGGVVAIAVLVGVLTPAWTQLSSYGEQNADWIGYQRAIGTTQGVELHSLIRLAERRGGGRIYAGLPSNWGYHFMVGGVQVYNFLEDTSADAMGLTLRTFSLMTDPEAWFDQDNPGDYSVFGVHYILGPTDLRPSVPATLLKVAGPFALWSVNAGGLIQVVDTTAPIAANASDLGKTTNGFLASDLPDRGIYPTIAFAGQPAATPTLGPGESPVGPAGRVLASSEDLAAGTARAVVEANRTSVVLLKASFDPGWTATIDGESVSPEMIAPALLGVTVAPGTHTVVFTYRGYGSYALLFGIALATLVGIGVGPIVWRRRHRVGRRGRAPDVDATAA